MSLDLSRLSLIIGQQGIELLAHAAVDIFGLGGVGGHAMEALCRAGVGTIRIYDFDRIESSNSNRQILATTHTLGMKKIDAAAERCRSINPSVAIITNSSKLTPENIQAIVPPDCLYAIDAIDDVPAKTALIKHLYKTGSWFISSMGSGNRMSPLGITVKDISETTGCPLARAIRRELKKEDIITGVTCVISTAPAFPVNQTESGKRLVGSSSFLPGIFGLTMAGHCINAILAAPGNKIQNQ